MIAVDAVTVYGLFGLSIEAIFSVLRFAVTLLILYFTIRIPFKRSYHWAFIILTLAYAWFSFWISVAFLSTTASDASVGFFWNFVMGGKVQGLLAFQFVAYFVSRRIALWEKLVLVAGYAYVAAVVWVPMIIDPSFLFSGPTLNSFGWGLGTGTGDAYLRPDGIDLFVTLMLVLSYLLLVRYYRSEKSPLIRGQIIYLMVGLAIIFAGAYQSYIQRALAPSGHYASIQNLVSIPGDLILLLGLKRKGFYSVTPVPETATAPVAVVYPLQEGRTYLVQDVRVSADAFAGLVRTGREGLLITRTFPEDARKDFGLETTPIRWLAESASKDVIAPTDLLGLSVTIKDFMRKAAKPVVMLQGIEYLTTINGFNPLLRLLEGLSEANAEKRGILLLPVNLKSLDEKEESLLNGETTPFPSTSPVK